MACAWLKDHLSHLSDEKAPGNAPPIFDGDVQRGVPLSVAPTVSDIDHYFARIFIESLFTYLKRTGEDSWRTSS